MATISSISVQIRPWAKVSIAAFVICAKPLLKRMSEERRERIIQKFVAALFSLNAVSFNISSEKR